MHSRKLGPGGAHQKLERYAVRLEREGGPPGIVLAIRVMLDHRLDLLTRLHPDKPFPDSAYLLRSHEPSPTPPGHHHDL